VLIVGGVSIVSIGADVDIAPRVTIVTGSHNTDMIGKRSAGKGYSENIIIEDGVWIGAGTTILGGITIGKKAIIGAGSVVSRSIPPAVIAVGNPCRPIKRWDPVTGWEKINS
jgi:maltose O-acetyltransferase